MFACSRPQEDSTPTRRAHWRGRRTRASPTAAARSIVERLGRDPDGPRYVLLASPRPIGHPVMRRVRMIATVARQGYELCAARDRSAIDSGAAVDRSLEPLLPGFLSASAAMSRVVEQIQRMQGNDLTVLITGESGTGKELVARADSRRLAPQRARCSCPTTARRRAATWPTASCSATAAARSPARCRTSRG